MTDEKQEVKECNCFCKSKWFKKFIVVTLGTFTGVLLALSLFTALNKPPMPQCPYKNFINPPIGHRQGFRGDREANFQKDIMPPINVRKPESPDIQRPEPPRPDIPKPEFPQK